jgi:hypothetical protein
MKSLRAGLDLARDAWRAQWLAVGSLVIMTREKEISEGRLMFDLGRDVGAAHGPAPRPEPARRLQVVS